MNPTSWKCTPQIENAPHLQSGVQPKYMVSLLGFLFIKSPEIVRFQDFFLRFRTEKLEVKIFINRFDPNLTPISIFVMTSATVDGDAREWPTPAPDTHPALLTFLPFDTIPIRFLEKLTVSFSSFGILSHMEG